MKKFFKQGHKITTLPVVPSVEVDSMAVLMLLIVASRPFLFANKAFKILIFSGAPLSPDDADIVPVKG